MKEQLEFVVKFFIVTFILFSLLFKFELNMFSGLVFVLWCAGGICYSVFRYRPSILTIKNKFKNTIGFDIIGKDMSVIDELEKEVLKYRLFFDMSPNFLFMIDAESGMILEANSRALKYFNHLGENNGKSFLELFTDDFKRVSMAYERVIGNGIVKSIEITNRDVKGEVCELEINLIPIKENDRVVKVLSYIRDITEKKQAERLREKVQERNILIEKIKEYNKLKTDFISNMSHEFRTPLNVLLSTVQLLEVHFRNNPCLSGKTNFNMYTDMMKNNCYRLLKLINNLMDLTQIENGFFSLNLQNCDIIEITKNITLLTAEHFKEKGRIITFHSETVKRIVACDQEKIKKILLNLLSNAIKFTKEGDSIKVTVIDSKEYVVITVEDTGAGIPEEKQKFIFQRFRRAEDLFTRNSEGIGLGLSLAKYFIELHDGTINVESKLGEGSKFTIKLPVKILSEQQMSLINNYGEMEDYAEQLKIEFSDLIH